MKLWEKVALSGEIPEIGEVFSGMPSGRSFTVPTIDIEDCLRRLAEAPPGSRKELLRDLTAFSTGIIENIAKKALAAQDGLRGLVGTSTFLLGDVGRNRAGSDNADWQEEIRGLSGSIYRDLDRMSAMPASPNGVASRFPKSEREFRRFVQIRARWEVKSLVARFIGGPLLARVNRFRDGEDRPLTPAGKALALARLERAVFEAVAGTQQSECADEQAAAEAAAVRVRGRLREGRLPRFLRERFDAILKEVASGSPLPGPGDDSESVADWTAQIAKWNAKQKSASPENLLHDGPEDDSDEELRGEPPLPGADDPPEVPQPYFREFRKPLLRLLAEAEYERIGQSFVLLEVETSDETERRLLRECLAPPDRFPRLREICRLLEAGDATLTALLDGDRLLQAEERAEDARAAVDGVMQGFRCWMWDSLPSEDCQALAQMRYVEGLTEGECRSRLGLDKDGYGALSERMHQEYVRMLSRILAG